MSDKSEKEVCSKNIPGEIIFLGKDYVLVNIRSNCKDCSHNCIVNIHHGTLKIKTDKTYEKGDDVFVHKKRQSLISNKLIVYLVPFFLMLVTIASYILFFNNRIIPPIVLAVSIMVSLIILKISSSTSNEDIYITSEKI